MEQFNKLSKAEMKNVLGGAGTDPFGPPCVKKGNACNQVTEDVCCDSATCTTDPDPENPFGSRCV
jgi:hypothetical protein